MNKKILSVFAVLCVLLTATGCGSSEPAQTTAAAQENTAGQTTKEAADSADDAEDAEDEEEDNADWLNDEDENGGEDTGDRTVNGFSLSVNGADGKMSIARAAKKSTPMGDEDTWTIFIYLCGTDLEGNIAAASGDVVQMCQAEASDNVRFVFQTGGTEQWQNEMFSSEACERYIVQNNDVTLVDSAPLTNMGDPATLESFLEWGIENYPAGKMGFVFWDHGGGSITGACVDQLNENDTLYLSEINEAFSKVYAKMTDKFEFIGFDCCLMGTAETANILATYARYFYGSQETEPGTGWDYTAIGNFLAQNPSANGGELGKELSDSFYNECAAGEQEDGCTFTIIDCEKFDDFAIAFNDYAKELYEAAGGDLAGIVRGVNSAENFGGNDKSEGFTNMVDIGGIVNNCSSYADGSNVLEALADCIVYNKNGANHTGASGLSVYYPLSVQGSEELKVFSGICISPYYLSLVDMVAKGYTGNGYDNQVFFTEDGNWYNQDGSTESYDNSYFEYADEESDDNSKLITFAEAPHFDDSGNYTFTLDESGKQYAASVSALILMQLGDGTMLELGETYNIGSDWENGVFADQFGGYWLSLPNGTLLSMFIVGTEDGRAIYTSPVELNGKRTNLRVIQTSDDLYIEGAWDGIDENGMASREIRKLNPGDQIAPVYYILEDGDSEKTQTGDAYEWSEGDSVIYGMLPNSDYYYAFSIDDVYGDFFLTDPVVFTIADEGISFAQMTE